MELTIKKKRVSCHSGRMNAISYEINDFLVIRDSDYDKTSNNYTIKQIYRSKDYEIEYTIKTPKEYMVVNKKRTENISAQYFCKNNIFTCKILITDKNHGRYVIDTNIPSYIIGTYKLKDKSLDINISLKISRNYFQKQFYYIPKMKKNKYDSRFYEDQHKFNTHLDKTLYSENTKAVILEANTNIGVGPCRQHKCAGSKYQPKLVDVYLVDVNNEKQIFTLEKCEVCGKLFITYEVYKKIVRRFPKYVFNLHEDRSKIENNNHGKKIQKEKRKIVELSIGEFLTRTSIYRCISENHKIVDIKAKIKIVRSNGIINEIQIPAGLCLNCNKYFILESEYNKVKKQGIILCKLVEMNYWKQVSQNLSYSMNEESMLHMLGYNVNAQSNISRNARWALLETIMDEKILTKLEICSHLDYLIKRSRNQNQLKMAVDKWREDRAYVGEYVIDNINIEKANIIIKNNYR